MLDHIAVRSDARAHDAHADYISSYRANAACVRELARLHEEIAGSLAAASATDDEQRADVNRRTADLLETAGWSEVPPGTHRGPPATREIVSDDLDLSGRK